MKQSVIIVAGGKGLRMGSDLPKQFLPMGDKPVLMHTLEVFRRYDEALQIILVLPQEQQSFWKQQLGDMFDREVEETDGAKFRIRQIIILISQIGRFNRITLRFFLYNKIGS